MKSYTFRTLYGAAPRPSSYLESSSDPGIAGLRISRHGERRNAVVIVELVNGSDVRLEQKMARASGCWIEDHTGTKMAHSNSRRGFVFAMLYI